MYLFVLRADTDCLWKKNTDHTDKATRRSRLRTPFSRARGLSRFAPLAFGELLPQPLGRCFEKTGKWYKISNAQAAAAAARDCKERERRVAVCALAVAGAFIVDALEKKD